MVPVLALSCVPALLCLFRAEGGRRLSLPAPQSRAYDFDRVFPPGSTQDDVYAYVRPLLRGTLDGFNAAFLAYGQTASGKTYTLGFEGAPEAARKEPEKDRRRDGILPRACQDLFDLQEEKAQVHRSQGERLDVQVRPGRLSGS